MSASINYSKGQIIKFFYRACSYIVYFPYFLYAIFPFFLFYNFSEKNLECAGGTLGAQGLIIYKGHMALLYIYTARAIHTYIMCTYESVLFSPD